MIKSVNLIQRSQFNQEISNFNPFEYSVALKGKKSFSKLITIYFQYEENTIQNIVKFNELMK